MIIAMLQDNPLISKSKRNETPEDSENDEIEVVEPAIGWAYIGSHNFTPSAWGTLSGSAFNPILNVSVLFDFTFTRSSAHPHI
jgi:tyrosyl-DNA phosphodiesterase-1